MESKKFISIKDVLETCYLEMNNAEKELIFTKLVNEAKQEGISSFELEIPNGISPKTPIKYRVELDRCVIRAFDKISFLNGILESYSYSKSMFKSDDYDIRSLYLLSSFYDKQSLSIKKREISLSIDNGKYFIEDTYDSRGNKNIVSREENSISDVLFYFDGEDNVKSIILDDRMFNEAEFLYQILEKNLNNEKNKQLCKDLQ
ncbi:MAG: hypothetical protein PUF22_03460 [Clostridium sp.]|nr:hypothetical protein [Clostridium sp.]